MRSYILFSVVCLQIGWAYGEPAGVGVYAYQDSAGNRYGGTYDLDDAQVFGKGKQGGQNFRQGGFWGDFVPPFVPNFPQPDDFFPQYFSNLDNLLREAFNSNLENQRRAFNAAKKAFDLTSNNAGYMPHFPSRYNDYGGFDMSRFAGPNSAFAGAAAGPGYTHQVAALSPENPEMPNVNVLNRFGEEVNPNGNFYSVSSSSFASSSNLNGKESTQKGAETIVNNNGKVTHYKVQS